MCDNRHRRRAVVVEGAETDVLASLRSQRHSLANDRQDVGRGEDTVAISEGASNCVGTLRAAGAASCTMSFTVYVSDSPYTPAGVDPGFLPGDLVQANVTNGMLAYGGEFIVESFKASLDPQEMTTVEMSLQSSGDLTLRKTGVVSCG